MSGSLARYRIPDKQYMLWSKSRSVILSSHQMLTRKWSMSGVIVWLIYSYLYRNHSLRLREVRLVCITTTGSQISKQSYYSVAQVFTLAILHAVLFYKLQQKKRKPAFQGKTDTHTSAHAHMRTRTQVILDKTKSTTQQHMWLHYSKHNEILICMLCISQYRTPLYAAEHVASLKQCYATVDSLYDLLVPTVPYISSPF